MYLGRDLYMPKYYHCGEILKQKQVDIYAKSNLYIQQVNIHASNEIHTNVHTIQE